MALDCKILDFVVSASPTTSTWLVVIMTLDRCLAITRPLSIHKWRELSNVKYIILVIIIISSVYAVPFSFTAGIVNGVCTIVTGEYYFLGVTAKTGCGPAISGSTPGLGQ